MTTNVYRAFSQTALFFQSKGPLSGKEILARQSSISYEGSSYLVICHLPSGITVAAGSSTYAT